MLVLPVLVLVVEVGNIVSAALRASRARTSSFLSVSTRCNASSNRTSIPSIPWCPPPPPPVMDRVEEVESVRSRPDETECNRPRTDEAAEGVVVDAATFGW